MNLLDSKTAKASSVLSLLEEPREPILTPARDAKPPYWLTKLETPFCEESTGDKRAEDLYILGKEREITTARIEQKKEKAMIKSLVLLLLQKMV